MPSSNIITAFILTLKEHGFNGDIEKKLAERLMLATDNSIYEILPSLCLFPKDEQDVVLVAKIIFEPEFRSLNITSRGGGTGTNGQSLNQGIMLDFSRYMHKILEIDPINKKVTVQAGVIKDQLNKALKEHNLFFAPELSTSNRATLGGMINTDASGQGSCTYGKTRDHVLTLNTVLLGGEILTSRSLSKAEFEELNNPQNIKTNQLDINKENPETSKQLSTGISAGISTGIPTGIPTEISTRISKKISTQISKLVLDNHVNIIEKFPKLNRCLTGYDLAHVWDESLQNINLNNIICGSEGTLGFVTQATLNCLEIVKYQTLVNIAYYDFDGALADAYPLMQSDFKPLSIEIIDDKVLSLAKQDFIWESVKEFFNEDPSHPIKALNLVEFNAPSQSQLDNIVQNFCDFLQKNNPDKNINNNINKPIRASITIASGSDAVKRVYAMRKRAVGLLGNVHGERRPLPFVEDTAVPPENLAAYIREFRAILDENNLSYGMFGHADAGVLHVRPALDMKTAHDRAQIKSISDQVALLCQKYGGVLWGEHGKGVRSSYAPLYFGDLYPLIQQVKMAFDPYNQLNPGKIATVINVDADINADIKSDMFINKNIKISELYSIDKTPMRGIYDEKIKPKDWQDYQSAVHCNGNGACFNYDLDDAMCPSYKATNNRLYSPKGRAMLIKEWLRQKADIKISDEDKWAFAKEVNASLENCLACKSCSGQCPIKVDVPRFRSDFLNDYYQRAQRPFRDFILANSEKMAPFVQAFSFAPFLMNNPLITRTMLLLGLQDLPSAKRSNLGKLITQKKVRIANINDINKYINNYINDGINKGVSADQEKLKHVIIIPDAFTQFFDPDVLCASISLLVKLNITVWLAPYQSSGKAEHVLGMSTQFKKAAHAKIDQLKALAQTGIKMIGIEPAVALMAQSEYKILDPLTPNIELFQVWLVNALEQNIIQINPDNLNKDIFNNNVLNNDLSNQDLVNKNVSNKNMLNKYLSKEFLLLSHCTEKTAVASAPALWQTLFASFGLKLKLEASGCCGMSGMFGHLKEKQELSKAIYALSFKRIIAKNKANITQVLATGYSCRTQIKRFDDIKVNHPISVLADIYQALN